MTSFCIMDIFVLYRHSIRWLWKILCVYCTCSGLNPQHKEVAKAIANNPQLLLPLCICTTGKLMVVSFSYVNINAAICFRSSLETEPMLRLSKISISLDLQNTFEIVIQWFPCTCNICTNVPRSISKVKSYQGECSGGRPHLDIVSSTKSVLRLLLHLSTIHARVVFFHNPKYTIPALLSNKCKRLKVYLKACITDSIVCLIIVIHTCAIIQLHSYFL